MQIPSLLPLNLSITSFTTFSLTKKERTYHKKKNNIFHDSIVPVHVTIVKMFPKEKDHAKKKNK